MPPIVLVDKCKLVSKIFATGELQQLYKHKWTELFWMAVKELIKLTTADKNSVFSFWQNISVNKPEQLNSKRSPCSDFLGYQFTFFPLTFRQWPTFLLPKQTSQQLPQRSGWCGASLFCAGTDSGWGTQVRSLWVDGSRRDRVWWGWIQWTQEECQAGQHQRLSGEGMTTCPM